MGPACSTVPFTNTALRGVEMPPQLQSGGESEVSGTRVPRALPKITEITLPQILSIAPPAIHPPPFRARGPRQLLLCCARGCP